MNVTVQAQREGNHASLVLTGTFDLAHAIAGARALESAEENLHGCSSVDVDLTQLDRIDGAGAVLLARLLDRLEADGRRANVVKGHNSSGLWSFRSQGPTTRSAHIWCEPANPSPPSCLVTWLSPRAASCGTLRLRDSHSSPANDEALRAPIFALR
jgi:ABC-type transporter Mla MlaB component